MTQDIWINLPVQDLERAVAFFTAIGFNPNPGPGNTPTSASFTLGEAGVPLMLFVEDVFVGMSHNSAADPRRGTEVMFSLGAGSREAVDELAKRVVKAGGVVFAEPAEAQGFMYGCGFCDPDGHRWNALYMDPAQMPSSPDG